MAAAERCRMGRLSGHQTMVQNVLGSQFLFDPDVGCRTLIWVEEIFLTLDI